MVKRRKRLGRPLLRASVGVATVSFIACTGTPKVEQGPVGNLRPVESPLLTQPVSPRHGGREVFAGTADERYGVLRRWIEQGAPWPERYILKRTRSEEEFNFQVWRNQAFRRVEFRHFFQI